jgi:hypothetical protein
MKKPGITKSQNVATLSTRVVQWLNNRTRTHSAMAAKPGSRSPDVDA